jgi:hypothetical protein
MVDDFDIVAIGIEQDGGIVAWVVGPQTRRAIIFPAETTVLLLF